jgi:hypothetical protein
MEKTVDNPLKRRGAHWRGVACSANVPLQSTARKGGRGASFPSLQIGRRRLSRLSDVRHWLSGHEEPTPGANSPSPIDRSRGAPVAPDDDSFEHRGRFLSKA